MKLTTRGRYGTRVLLDVALHQGRGPVALKDVAQRQEISLAYTKRLAAELVTAGLLRSIRGVHGGVVLARPPHQTNLWQIIELLEGTTTLLECIANPDACQRSPSCVTRDVWTEIDTATHNILTSTTLQDLVDRHAQKTKAEVAMYYI